MDFLTPSRALVYGWLLYLLLFAIAPIRVIAPLALWPGLYILILDLNSDLPYAHVSKPIVIGRGVWLATNAKAGNIVANSTAPRSLNSPFAISATQSD